MPTGTVILLGAFAGLTIYLGLPIAFLKRAPLSLKAFLSMLATGILLFLLYDVVSKATEPINTLIAEVHTQHASGFALVGSVALVVLGLLIGLVGLAYFTRYLSGRVTNPARRASQSVVAPEPALAGVSAATDARDVAAAKQAQATPAAVAPAAGEMSTRTLALVIATGIGFHNFSEGLAIGQSAASGALQLAIVLIIGFGLHNMTEGFGIAGPMTGQRVSWKFIALLGLIGGGPTFLGTVVGIAFQSTSVFIFCLALAAGAIIYVVTELLGVAKRYHMPEIVMWGLLIGFLLGYVTDLIVTYAGA
ncbi:MAG TPA: ZIP family metal transporter [Ktedonobacteraceae bacterium]|nr:ZIP family metal transporter [Ktedonobacteraceae bacterium]